MTAVTDGVAGGQVGLLRPSGDISHYVWTGSDHFPCALGLRGPAVPTAQTRHPDFPRTGWVKAVTQELGTEGLSFKETELINKASRINQSGNSVQKRKNFLEQG